MFAVPDLRRAVSCLVVLGVVGSVASCGGEDDGAPASAAATGGAPGTGGTAGSSGTSTDSGRAGASGESAASFCGSVVSRGIEDVTLSGARLVAAESGVPAYCLVSGTLEGPLNFQVALPDNWNRKVLFIGGGAFDGVIPEIGIFGAGGLAAGYAVIANDSGHQGMGEMPSDDASWALDDERAVTRFAETSTHEVMAPATAIVRARYGREIKKVYFEGCSNGGREALIAAQRWPNDFDGIIARAPALNFTGAMTAFQRNARLVDALGGTLSRAKLKLVAEAELAACDEDDGVSDEIIGRPYDCRFDSTTLLCDGATDDTCLSELELTTLNGIRSATPLPYAQRDSIAQSAAWGVGHEVEESWWVWFFGSGGPSVQSVLQDQFIKYFVTKNPSEDTLATSLDEYAAEMEQASALLDASDPDLSDFRASGGKLILWHGLADPALAAAETAAYYERAVKHAGGRAEADEFLRYFTAAGVYHCIGGPGADWVDLLGSLDAWVSDGTAPDDLVATSGPFSTRPTPISRPLCAYPSYPRYVGSGDSNVAASYSCAQP
jgi:hypothetical protein